MGGIDASGRRAVAFRLPWTAISGEVCIMARSFPPTRDVLLIGGGHAHALLLKMWGKSPLPGIRLTLVNPGPRAAYTGMLPGLVAGHYRLDELEIDLVRLARFAGARLILDRVTGLDPDKRVAMLAEGAPVSFDMVSVNSGVSPVPPDIPGAAEMMPVRPLHEFATAWERFAAAADDGGAASAGVIGGGVGGVELALAMAHRLRGANAEPAAVQLFECENDILSGDPVLARPLRAALDRAGISLRTGFEARSYAGGTLTGDDGTGVRAGFLALATGGAPAPWLAGTGLDLTGGSITVGETLQSVTHAHVFAVGDAAYLSHDPRPRAGVFAVRAAPVLFANIRAAATGDRMTPYRPQRDYLKLVSLGDRRAVGEKWGLTVSGAAVWHLKDRIDRRFMDRVTRRGGPEAGGPSGNGALS